MGILSTATLRSNRPAGCPLMSDKDLKAKGRGSFDYHIDLNSSLRVVKWYYNKGVILGSSLFLVEASSTKRRWDFVKKDHCNVTYPEIVKEYNESMSGMDLNDMLISLTVWIYKQEKDGTWKLSPIASTFLVSTVAYSIEDIESNCECQKRINKICYSLWRV